MIRRLLFPWLFFKNRFAEALACLKNGIEPRSSNELYACYRLGLYETVANSRRGDDRWRGGSAVPVLLAACGRDIKASELACGLVAKYRLGGSIRSRWRMRWHRLRPSLR